MKNIFQFNKNAVALVILFFCLFFNPNSGEAQTAVWTKIDPYGDTITISVVQSGGVCGQPEGIYYDNSISILNYTNYYNYSGVIARTGQSNPSKRFNVQAGVPFDVTFEFRGKKNGTNMDYFLVDGLGNNYLKLYQASLAEQNPVPAGNTVTIQSPWGIQRISKYTYKNIVFGKSATLGYLLFEGGKTVGVPVSPGSQTYTSPGNLPQIILPLFITGNVEGSVPVLGTTVQPQIPYLVLHAPPGDGSSSAFQETKTTCREFTETYSEDGSNSVNAAVKLGIAGSVGFIVTTDFEFSVTLSAGVTVGGVQIKTNSKQTCVTTSQGFETGSLDGLDGGGDVFIGYGTDLNYGIYSKVMVDPNTCLAILDTSLIYTPTGDPRDFAYSESQIQQEIVDQKAIAGNPANSVRARNIAQNQADVWEKVLALNTANKNNPNNQLIQSLSFSSGISSTQESSITVLETNSLDVEHYVDFNVGLSSVIEIAGSGVSGGWEYKGSYRYGKTQTQSQEATKLVKYSLKDNSTGDKFDLKVVRDPMFGTPVFRLEPTSKTSCPYQGGYQRDQPKLKIDGSTSDHITLQGNPVGSSASFKLDVCNESNEVRTYNLKLNAASNLNGAVVSAAGVPLNGNDLGQVFLNVPANGCIQNLVIEVKQLSVGSPLSYPDLELYLYAPCEEDIQSSVFASVYFGNATAVNDLADNSLLSVSPNPTSGWLQISLPTGNDLEAVRVTDLAGKTVRNLELGAGSNITEVDLSGLPKGMYALQARAAGQVFVKKVIVE